MEIHAHYRISTLRKSWNRIYNKQKDILPIYSYYYFKYLFIAFYVNIQKVLRRRIVFLHLTDKCEECILPLIINKHRHTLTNLSAFGTLDYDDVISTTNDIQFLSDCLTAVLTHYKNYNIQLHEINENSLIYKTLSHFCNSPEPCVAINFGSDYNTYLEKVSKHQRQNIRTAYNKLKKDDIEYTIKVYNKDYPITRTVWRKCLEMYEANYKKEQTFFQKVWWRRTSPINNVLLHHDSRLIYVLYFNDIPVAYMGGMLREGQQTYYVPRLSIDRTWGKYSPGIILLNEVIKILVGSKVETIDLMRGTETYKMAMGGQVHYNYMITDKCCNLLQENAHAS